MACGKTCLVYTCSVAVRVSAGGRPTPHLRIFLKKIQSGLMLQMGKSAHGCKKRIEKKGEQKDEYQSGRTHKD